MNLLSRLTGRRRAAGIEARAGLLEIFQTWQDKEEKLQHDFVNYVREGYKSNGIVFSVILARMLLFTEARFAFRNRTTKELLWTPALEVLEKPWPGGTTGELLARREQDISLAGNSYVYKAEPRRLQRLRPDWVDVVGSEDGTDLLAYLYHQGGRHAGHEPKILLPEEVSHWAPIPDPERNYVGMSWLQPIANEINADKAMTRHKGKFFTNAATPNMLIKVQGKLPDPIRKRLEAQLKERHEGWENAYKTLIVEGGADATVVGTNMRDLAFAATQAAGENRICIAGGVPSIIVGLKEGLQAATYSNYGQAMRRFSDFTMRSNWRGCAAATAPIIDVPDGAELWYDDQDIPALQQDAKDAAEIFRIKAETAAALIRVGYEPDEVGAIVEAGRGLDQLTHTGGIPVTLYEGGHDPSTNGNGRDVRVSLRP